MQFLSSAESWLSAFCFTHAPLKEIKIRSRPCPFVNQEIKDLMKSRDCLLKQFTQSCQDNDWKNFKLSCDLVKEKLKLKESTL